MEHIIIGAGNLGLDLQVEIMRQLPDARVNVLSHSSGFDVTDEDAFLLYLKDCKADYIWYCVGAGSVEDADKHPDNSKKVYINAPRNLLKYASRKTHLIFFSTDYAANEEFPDDPRLQAMQVPGLSMYAHMKIFMESSIQAFDRPRTTVVRVGSLYGTHKPKATFPGKILNAFAAQKGLRVRLPQNLVTPTPTLWAASQLVANMDLMFNDEGSTRHHLAPRGNVSVFDWGVFVLTGIRESSAFVREQFYDEKRPRFSGLGSDFLPTNWHWHELYKTYFQASAYVEGELPTAVKPSSEKARPAAEQPVRTSSKSPSKQPAKRSS